MKHLNDYDERTATPLDFTTLYRQLDRAAVMHDFDFQVLRGKMGDRRTWSCWANYNYKSFKEHQDWNYRYDHTNTASIEEALNKLYHDILKSK